MGAATRMRTRRIPRPWRQGPVPLPIPVSDKARRRPHIQPEPLRRLRSDHRLQERAPPHRLRHLDLSHVQADLVRPHRPRPRVRIQPRHRSSITTAKTATTSREPLVTACACREHHRRRHRGGHAAPPSRPCCTLTAGRGRHWRSGTTTRCERVRRARQRPTCQPTQVAATHKTEIAVAANATAPNTSTVV